MGERRSFCADVIGERGEGRGHGSEGVWEGRWLQRSMSPEWWGRRSPTPNLLSPPSSLYLKHPLSLCPGLSLSHPSHHPSQSLSLIFSPSSSMLRCALLCPSSLLGGDSENQIAVQVMFSRSSQAKWHSDDQWQGQQSVLVWVSVLPP